MTQEITRQLADEASGGATFATAEWAPRHADQQPRARGVLGWLFLVVVIVALWPATWGGLTGITVISGNSMEPVYGINDVVLTLRQSTYVVGDVVSFTVPEGQEGAGGDVIHRIVAVDASGEQPVFTTQGDNNTSADTWKLSITDVVGRAVLRVPRIGVAFTGSSGLLLGAAAGLTALVTLRPSRPSARKSAQKPTVIPSGL